MSSFSTSSIITLHVFVTKASGADRHTDANETFQTEGYEGDVPAEGSECRAGVKDVLHHFKDRLLGDTLGKDGCFGHVEVKSNMRTGLDLNCSGDQSGPEAPHSSWL